MEGSGKIKEVFKWIRKRLLRDVVLLVFLGYPAVLRIVHTEESGVPPFRCWLCDTFFTEAMSFKHIVDVDIFRAMCSSGTFDHIVQSAN